MTSEPNAGTTGQVEAPVEPIASKRYALAALALAQQHSDAPAWQNALRQTAEFMGDPEVKRVLENSRVGQEPKQRLISAALNDLPVLQLNFARLLVRKNRTSLAGELSLQLVAVSGLFAHQSQDGVFGGGEEGFGLWHDQRIITQ